MTTIHATAVIHQGAVIGKDCNIGPYCVIGPKVKLGDRCILHSHVVIEGNTTIGEECEIFPFASLGHKPQDLKFKGEDTRLIIGSRNKIREYVTMQPGTAGDRAETIVGNDCLFMASTHVAHDCIVGNNVILANCATLAGHVTIGDHAILGGLAAVRQWCRVGAHAMIGGLTAIESDVIPYGMAVGSGARANLAGLNLVGLERRGFEKQAIQDLRSAFKMIFENDEGTLSDRVKKATSEFANQNLVKDVVDFIQSKSGAALCQPKKSNG